MSLKSLLRAWVFGLWIVSVFGKDGLPSLDDSIDKSDWVDPMDIGVPMAPSSMMGKMKEVREREGGKRINKEEEEAHPPSPPSPSLKTRLKEASQCGQVETQLWQCKQKLRHLEEIVDSSGNVQPRVPPESSSSDATFLFRHIHFLLRHLPIDYDAAEPYHRFRAELVLTQEDLSLLRRFVGGGKGVAKADVDRVLTDMFGAVEPMAAGEDLAVRPEFNFTWGQHLLPCKEDLFWALVVAVFGSFLLMLWRGVPVWKVTLLLLAVSSAWHWTHLYKRVLSKKHSTLIKSKDVPPECFPDDMTWTQFVFDRAFGSKDKCAAYHEALLVDPFLEVSPTMAVSETIVQFVLLPAEHLGRHIGKFFNALLGELTWLSSSPVLIFVFFAFLLMLVMAFGYRFKLPFFLGSFEPRNSQAGKTTDTQLEGLKSEIESLQSTLLDQHSILQQYISNAKESQLALTEAKKEEGNSAVEDITKEKQKVFTDASDNHKESDRKENKQYSDKSVSIPTRTTKPADQFTKSPRKRLVASGSLLSPGETDFQWVEESDGPLDVTEEDNLSGNCSLPSEEKSKQFLNKIETVFHDEEVQ